ncbi:MAG: glycosyltransferase family 2 protein [Gammaproteobacteria bacterium]|jgi:glycosyltransferase involved in cell wall biosynthesis
MKLLSVCIPTYKRPETLRRCIDAAVAQVEKYALKIRVEVFVANDASPDDTASVLANYADLEYFNGVNREQNLGMSANIRQMLQEAAAFSVYQLIVTDDDYLLDDTLPAIVEMLDSRRQAAPETAVIWTPRYSYREDGILQTIACQTFEQDSGIPPSIVNSGRYMYNGFVLSGLIVRSAEIDFSFWSEYIENAYFPVIFCGDLMRRHSSFYWHRSIVHHSVLNECHWERWGQSDAEITLRLFIDFVNAYVFIGRRIDSFWQRIRFYSSAFPRVFQMTNSLLITSGGFYRLSPDEAEALLTIDRVSFARVETASRVLFLFVGCKILMGCLFKATAFKLLSIVTPDSGKRKSRREAFERIKQWLGNAAFIMRWAS